MEALAKVGNGIITSEKELASGAIKTSRAKPTFKSVKEQIKAANPDLSASKVKVMAEQVMSKLSGEFDSVAVAALVESGKLGFHVEKIEATELKSGKCNIVIKASKNAPKAAKAKTKAEIIKEMEALKAEMEALKAKTIEG